MNGQYAIGETVPGRRKHRRLLVEGSYGTRTYPHISISWGGVTS